MSKALLKKSLVFVKEGSSDDGRKVGDRKGEGKKRADLKLPLSNLVASEKSYKKRRPNRSSFSSKSTVEGTKLRSSLIPRKFLLVILIIMVITCHSLF